MASACFCWSVSLRPSSVGWVPNVFKSKKQKDRKHHPTLKETRTLLNLFASFHGLYFAFQTAHRLVHFQFAGFYPIYLFMCGVSSPPPLPRCMMCTARYCDQFLFGKPRFSYLEPSATPHLAHGLHVWAKACENHKCISWFHQWVGVEIHTCFAKQLVGNIR